MGQSSESSLCLLRVIQRDVMLRSSSSSSGQRFPFAPPGRSRWQEGVLLQGHPRPWPFAKLRTLWVPAHKVQGTKTDNAVLTFYLAFSLGGARASCHLRHSVPDKEAVHVRVAPVGGFLVLHSRAGSARRQRPGSRQSRQPRLRRRSSKVSRHGGRLVYPRMLFLQPLQAAAGGATCRSFRASVGRAVPARALEAVCLPHGAPVWSLSASGSLRSPVRGPAKAHRPQAYAARPPPRPYPPLRFGALLV